jgi:hypothetical protein
MTKWYAKWYAKEQIPLLFRNYILEGMGQVWNSGGALW